MLRPLRLAYGLAPVIEVLEAHGHDISPLLSATDIPRFALEEPSYRIRFDQELNFIRRALATLARPTAGLEVGMRYNLAIFGVGRIQKEVVVREVDGMDTLAIRPMGVVSLGFDHRLIDGATADLFMADVKKTIETWDIAP